MLMLAGLSIVLLMQGTSQIQRLIVSRDILTDPSLVTP